MARLSLKNIIGKKSASFALVQSFLEQLKADISIEDENGKILSGNERRGSIFHRCFATGRQS